MLQNQEKLTGFGLKQVIGLKYNSSLKSVKSPSFCRLTARCNRYSSMSSTTKCFTSTLAQPSRSEAAPPWASYNIPKAGTNSEYVLRGFVNGSWMDYSSESCIPVEDPMYRFETIFKVPDLKSKHLIPYIEEVNKVPRSGLFNVFKNPEKYVEYGKVMAAVARELHDPVTCDYFTKLIQLTMPKSRSQALAEVTILRLFCENFSGDRVRMLMRGFAQAGDRAGQMSTGFRFPYGATAVVAPFNFPLEIIAMQSLASLMVGNYTVIKAASVVGIVMEAFLELLLHCGLDPSSVAMIPAGGQLTQELLTSANFRLTQFTGSSTVGERLTSVLDGKVKLEDAGFDMKVLGPDAAKIGSSDWNHATWQCDQDAYAISGQKCSAQSFLAIHKNWLHGKEIDRSQLIVDLKSKAESRSTDSLSLGPILGHSNASCEEHVSMLSNALVCIV
eukprot:GHVH01012096.1.p1 GENE.GHVH01012096.1~~GHVH01012096.1.p1  ORF type:complete len:444 (+),score=50.65 GHVH01012096.1:45-1376(+)